MKQAEATYEDSNFVFKIDDLNITVHRSTTPETENEERRRLVAYVHKICELGNKYMPEIQSIEEKRKENN